MRIIFTLSVAVCIYFLVAIISFMVELMQARGKPNYKELVVASLTYAYRVMLFLGACGITLLIVIGWLVFSFNFLP